MTLATHSRSGATTGATSQKRCEPIRPLTADPDGSLLRENH